jgi:hypothetical protein
VSWQTPFEVVPAADHLDSGSPWRTTVARLLWDVHADGRAMIADTHSAGLVAVHFAVAREDLTVISVSADPAVPCAEVLLAAHELGALAGGDWGRLARSVYDLPLGSGHSWEIAEREVRTYEAGVRLERIVGVSLPAWRIEGKLDLKASSLFGTAPALETLRQLIGPRPDDKTEAAQTAVASFTRYGFEAAAVTALGVRASATRQPPELGTERAAILRFDHPYAAIAVHGRPAPAGRVVQGPPPDSAFTGLPLFSAWIADPQEPEDEPPAA